MGQIKKCRRRIRNPNRTRDEVPGKKLTRRALLVWLFLYVFPFLVTLLVCGYSFYGVYRFVSEWSAVSQHVRPTIQNVTPQDTKQNNSIKKVFIGGHWYFNGLSWTCSEKTVTNDFFINQWNQFSAIDNIDNIDRIIHFQNEPDELEKLVLNMLAIMPFTERKNNTGIDKMFFYTENDCRLRFITRQKQPELKQRIVLVQAIFQQDADHWLLLEFLPYTNQPHKTDQQQTQNTLLLPNDFVTICSRTNETGNFVFSLYKIDADFTEEQLVTFWRVNGWNVERDSGSQKTLFPIVCSKDENAMGVKLFLTNRKITGVLVFDLNTTIVSHF
jgi:hypothetical protein